eukprot:Gb_07489 [translate_table: standard]
MGKKNISSATHASQANSSTAGSMNGNTSDIDLELLTRHIDAALSVFTNKGFRGKLPESHMTMADWVQRSASDFSKLFEGISQGAKTFSHQKVLMSTLSGEVQTVAVDVLKGFGNLHWAGIGLLAIATVLERLDKISSNDKECIELLSGMNDLAKCIKQLKYISDLHTEIKEKMSEGVQLIVGGAIMCCSFIRSKKISKLLLVSKIREELVDLRARVDRIFRDLMFQMQMKTLYFCMTNTSQRPNPVAKAVEIEERPEEVEEDSDAEESDDNNSRCASSSTSLQLSGGHSHSLPNSSKEKPSSSDDSYKVDDRYPRPGILARIFRRPTGVVVPKTTAAPNQFYEDLGVNIQDFRDLQHGPAVFFSYKELRKATKDFHSDNLVGHGGSGSVYKGILEDGRQVAIKRRSDQSRYSNWQFVNEWRFMTRFQHRNLVKLVGVSFERSKASLVYEYLPNGGLDRYLFDDGEAARVLHWQRRMNIIVGVARGLVYLHEDSEFRIIHRDIKPGNILLDDNFNAKIADFGISTLLVEVHEPEDTRIAGTYGYMAPEYAMYGHLSEKADVFSFGLLMLEVVSGRRCVDMSGSEYPRLLDWAWKLHEEGGLRELIDSRLIDEEYLPIEVILRVIRISLLCTQEDILRPPMIRVLVMLLSEEAIDEMRPTNPNTSDVGSADSISAKEKEYDRDSRCHGACEKLFGGVCTVRSKGVASAFSVGFRVCNITKLAS